MKKFLATISVLAVMSVQISCAQETQTSADVQKNEKSKNQSGSSASGSLTLSWTTVATNSAYLVYYTETKKKPRIIDTVLSDNPSFKKGQLLIDGNNLETWPKSGEKACFHVVAEFLGVKSDPSSQACITL